MLSGVRECQDDFGPLGMFCVRVTFYCTAEARLGRPISTCWGGVTSLEMFCCSLCTRQAAWSASACKHWAADAHLLCTSALYVLILHPNTLFLLTQSEENPHDFIINALSVVVVLLSKRASVWVVTNADWPSALQPGASGTLSHGFEHHENRVFNSRRISEPLYPHTRDTGWSHVTHVEKRNIQEHTWKTLNETFERREGSFCMVLWLHLLASQFSAGTRVNSIPRHSWTTLEFAYLAAYIRGDLKS